MIFQQLVKEAFKFKVQHVYYTKAATKELIQPTDIPFRITITK